MEGIHIGGYMTNYIGKRDQKTRLGRSSTQVYVDLHRIYTRQFMTKLLVKNRNKTDISLFQQSCEFRESTSLS